MEHLSHLQWIAIVLIFVFTGFIRTAIGFGGAALGLPLLLLVKPDPLVFLPIIGIHLLVFTSLTLYRRLHNVHWGMIRQGVSIMLVPKLIGILGLLSLPATLMTLIVFAITLGYGLMYLAGRNVHSNSPWVDRALLVLGGYVSGTSLVGAPLIAAVYARHVEKNQLRDTLFVLWVILVSIKLIAFILNGVDLQLSYTLLLLPVAGLGHLAGLKIHDRLLHGDPTVFRRLMGGMLVAVTLIGIWRLL